MYKDKDKQREANRQASQRRRDKRKGMTKQGVTTEGMTQGVTSYIGCVPETKDTGVTFRPDCVTCEHMVDGGNDRAACDIGGCNKPKRGKDIKCFEDLHPDIQRTIIGLSIDDMGKVDEGEKQRRTAIAIHYQHLYPDRYTPTGYAGTNPNLGSLGTARIGELIG